MQKYNIEGNVNFYDELFKSLDDDSDDENTLCQITGFPLNSTSLALECNHKFNYEPLYKEICRQKFDFKSYDAHTLNKQDQIKIKASGMDYFIKCPYCRNIQFTILPYYEEIGLTKMYGVNSLDTDLPDKPKHKLFPSIYGSDDFTFCMYGKLFKKGECCFLIHPLAIPLCSNIYVTPIENTDKTFCKYHYKDTLKTMKMEEKQKKIKEKIKEKQQKQQLLDEKNTDRLAKGLLPLKRLPVVKRTVLKSVQNVVEQTQQIGQYIPDIDIKVEGEGVLEGVIEGVLEGVTQVISCKSILKSGPNKGTQCGCKKIYIDGLCKRHSQHDKE
jgi:hypothetical protein